MIVLLDFISRLKGNTFHMGDGFFKLKVYFNEYIPFYPFLDTTQLLSVIYVVSQRTKLFDMKVSMYRYMYLISV